MRAATWALLALCAGVPATAGAQGTDSLLAAAQRAARAWRAHDFASLVGGGGDVQLHLPGTDPSAPLRPTQAAELLRAFTNGAREVEVEVVVARNVDGDRAYVEIQRVYSVRGTVTRSSQTIYVGLRRAGASYRVAEIRVVP